MKKVNLLMLLFGTMMVLLTGCHHTHSPLHNIYYGYYDVGSDKHFVILVFSGNHPKQVATRDKLIVMEDNNIFPVTYSKNSVTIHGKRGAILLNISSDEHTLTCPSCDGRTLPRTYGIAMDKGKVFEPHIADIAFKSIYKATQINHGIRRKALY